MTYALKLGQRNFGVALSDVEQAYLARTAGRRPFKRAIERSHEGLNA